MFCPVKARPLALGSARGNLSARPCQPPRPLAALSTSSPAPSGPCEPFCPARPLREDAPSSSRAAQSSSPLCGCLRAPLSRSLCRRSRAPSLHLHRLDEVSLSRMVLAAFRSCPCELPCSRCFAPLSPPPLSPVLRPPRVHAMCSTLCGLHALLPPRAAARTGPLLAVRTEGERGVCPPPQGYLPAPALCPFRPSRFAPGAFPGRLPHSALCRSPGPSCLPGLPTVPRPPPCPRPCVRRRGRGAKEKDPFFPLGKRSPIKRRKSVDRRDNLYYTDILYQNGYLCLC